MAKYFCQISGEKRGPMGSSELRQLAQRGVLKPDDLVWVENTTQKVPASRVNGLFGAALRPAGAAAPATAPKAPAPLAPAPAPVPKPPAPAPKPVVQMAAVKPQAAAPLPLPPAVKAPVESGPIPLPPAMPVAPASGGPAVPAAPVIPDDPGPAIRIGKGYSYTKGGRWFGPVYVSAVAFYVVKKARSRSSYGGGLAGGLIAAATQGAADDTRTCLVGELPPAVRNALDAKGKLQAKDAIILPRGAVSLVKLRGLGSPVTVDCGGERFKLTAGLFNGKLRKFLTDAGWTLNQPIAPTTDAIHGRGFGRTADLPPPKQRTLAVRIAMIALAIAIIAAVIGLKIWADLQDQR